MGRNLIAQVRLMEHQIYFIMKKIILPSLLVAGLTLFSFTTSTGGGVNKIGKNLQQKSTGLNFTSEFKNSTEGKYNLVDTQLVVSKTEKGIEKNIKGNWIFKSKLSMSFFDANFITWDSPTVPTQALEIVKTLEKYSNDGIKKSDQSMYIISSKVEFKTEDQRIIRNFIEKEYNLSDSQKKQSNSETGVELAPLPNNSK